MPIPSPRKNEKRVDYINRFMSNETMAKEYPDTAQRAAVAYSKWREYKKGK